MTDNNQKKEHTKKRHKALKFFGKFILGLFLFIFVILLFIRSPWGQDIIVNKVVSYISNKTNTKVEVENLYLTFGGSLKLNGVYLEDTKGDTLIYSQSLEADLPLWSMIRGQAIGVDDLEWEGLRANIIRKDSITGYNFQFLIDALAPTDTTTVANPNQKPLNIILGELSFKDFNVVFNDDVAGINSHFKIGSLQADMEETNLENMVFEASNIELTNSIINYIQKQTPKTDDTEETPLPLIRVSNLQLVNVKAHYQSYINHLAGKFNISDLMLVLPKADLANNDYHINQFRLKNSTIALNTESETSNSTSQTNNNEGNNIQTFEWPDLTVAINAINFENNVFNYSVNHAEVTKGNFNPNAMAFTDFNFKANNIKLKDKTAEMHIDEASFSAASGLNLKNLGLDFSATDNRLKLTNFITAVNNTTLNASLNMEYPTLSALIDAPEKSKIQLDAPEFQVALKDIFPFQPKLKNNEYLKTLSSKMLTGNLSVQGYLSNIQTNTLNVRWGDVTHFTANGNIQNVTNPDSLQFDIPQFSLVTNRTDVSKFINESDLSIQLPEKAKISGNVKGSLNALASEFKLNTSQGVATFNGYLKNNEILDFDATLTTKEYKLNELLNNNQLGPLSLSLKADGTGQSINTLDADFKASISSFTYNNYNISDVNLDGTINDGKGTITSNYKDSNLNMDLNAQVVLDSVAPEAHVELHIIGADLQALGLMQRNVKTGMKITADFKGNTQNYNFDGLIDEGVMVYDNRAYLLGDLNFSAFVQTDTTSVTLKNKILDASLQSNTDPQTFSKAVQRHIFSYFYRDTKIPDSITNPVKLKVRGNISQAPILNDLFFVNLKDLDTVTVAINFNEKERLLKANINAPHINYNDLELDSLAFAMDTDKERFNFNLGFNEIKAGPINIQKTTFTGSQQNNELALNFQAFHNNQKLINIASEITGHREELHFHVVPDSLMLNKKSWHIPSNNDITSTENKLSFTDFVFSKNNQSVEITDQSSNTTKQHIAINFNDFNLSALLNYLNPDEQLATGTLNGHFILENPFEKTGIVADINLSKLSVMDVNMGTFTLDAKSLGGNKYDFNADLKDGEIDLDATGNYIGKNNEAILDLNLDINQFNMTALAGFSQGEITDANGSFSGNFTFSGSTKSPNYQGKINFNNADFKIAKLDANFVLANETLNIDNSGLIMDSFTIRDKNQNTFSISGNIGTESLFNPTFNLNATAKNFQFLNAKETDNDFLYGTASFDAEATITGDLQIPKINVDLTVGPTTNVTYILPSATVNLEERDGVVMFVNRENRDAILTRTEEETVSIKGFDIKAHLNIGNQAAITIIIDEKTGDNFKVSGEGNLDFTMNPNGNMSLAGIFEARDGHYEMNLYNLVNRKFNITSGSQVTWSGDPFDAKLDIKAIYDVEASASALMAPFFSNSNPSSKGKYRQVLPFQVYLNIDGQLMQPEINFNLDMPQEEQGAVDGQIYGRVQQLNQRPDELNRQVFSLLVLNRFYPDSGSDGSSGGVASLARNNLNDAVSDQLNIFSDKLLGNTGLELDFGLDSYTDYQGSTPQERTQLDIAAKKKLFNDRLIVSVGSEVDIQGSSSTEEQVPLIGNVSLEYLITENGRYRLKGFRRNEFENVIDGQTIVSGIALIFTQEFNKFSELWDAMFKSATENEEQSDTKEKTTEDSLNKKQ